MQLPLPLLPALLATAVLGSGCAIVQSTPDATAPAAMGMVYMLPKALLPVELVEDANGALLLRVKAPQLIGDTQQRYLLQAPSNAFSSDDVKIEVDPMTGLLKQVTASSDDKTLESLKELIASARGVRRAERDAAGETVLYAGLFDPDDSANTETLKGLQAALATVVDQWSQACSADTTDSAKCATVKRLKPAGVGSTPAVTMVARRLAPEAVAKASNGSPAVADCNLGVCHRGLQPFQVDLAIPGVFAQSVVLQLPNQSRPLVLPIDRAPFVKTEPHGGAQQRHGAEPTIRSDRVRHWRWSPGRWMSMRRCSRPLRRWSSCA